MTRFTVEVLPESEREFREAFLWYFERSPIAADGFRSHVLEAIDGLAERADMRPENDDGFHFHVLDIRHRMLKQGVHASVAAHLPVEFTQFQ